MAGSKSSYPLTLSNFLFIYFFSLLLLLRPFVSRDVDPFYSTGNIQCDLALHCNMQTQKPRELGS